MVAVTNPRFPSKDEEEATVSLASDKVMFTGPAGAGYLLA